HLPHGGRPVFQRRVRYQARTGCRAAESPFSEKRLRRRQDWRADLSVSAPILDRPGCRVSWHDLARRRDQQAGIRKDFNPNFTLLLPRVRCSNVLDAIPFQPVAVYLGRDPLSLSKDLALEKTL